MLPLFHCSWCYPTPCGVNGVALYEQIEVFLIIMKHEFPKLPSRGRVVRFVRQISRAENQAPFCLTFIIIYQNFYKASGRESRQQPYAHVPRKDTRSRSIYSAPAVQGIAWHVQAHNSALAIPRFLHLGHTSLKITVLLKTIEAAVLCCIGLNK